MSQESSRRASARRKDSSQPKDLGWLDSCDKHRNEGGRECVATTGSLSLPNQRTWGRCISPIPFDRSDEKIV
ncbi:hypothetical protein C9418_01090 [Rhizobium sp. SEMIA 4032]|nr:hypothetical protein C9418_01090 [Rhizobium sp. SEMIA 4032]